MVHQYRNNGYNIVLDVDSGSVHVVDDLVYDVIAFLKDDPSKADDAVTARFAGRYSPEEVSEALEEIRAQLEYREQNRSAVDAFHTTRTLGSGTRVYPLIRTLSNILRISAL